MAAVEEQSSFAAPPPESASIDELRSALHESLDQRGVLGRIRAQSRRRRPAPRPPRARPPARRLREEIFHAVDAGADTPKPGDAPVETLVVEELVREYRAGAGKGSSLGRFPLVSADFWTSDHPSERSRSVDAFSGTRTRGTLTLKRR
jgi:hypothetical protein